MMDGEVITGLRTAAASAVAVRVCNVTTIMMLITFDITDSISLTLPQRSFALWGPVTKLEVMHEC